MTRDITSLVAAADRTDADTCVAHLTPSRERRHRHRQVYADLAPLPA
ncbi:hypothetical protein AB0M31_13015 [Streptomyces sp. NPDC051773]